MRKNNLLLGGLVIVALIGVGLVVLIIGAAVVFGVGMGGAARPSTEATPNPFAAFVEVRNDCGQCGTDSPVGGWESENGRALVLAADGDFTALFDDGSSMSGSWKQSGNGLCLFPSTGGSTCYRYQQRVDAMKLDSAIYIRQ